jgi:hypothetical protein
MIIGVDYHPSLQAIAFCVEETGECGEPDPEPQRWINGEILSRPEAARSPRARRNGGYRIFTLVRAAAG